MYGKIVSLVEKKNIIQNFNGVVLDETFKIVENHSTLSHMFSNNFGPLSTHDHLNLYL
jgi:2-keto-3-deoxy-galactonokinase